MNEQLERPNRSQGSVLNRRDFIRASGGLVVAFRLFDPTRSLAAATSDALKSIALPPTNRLYAWLAIHPDNTATLYTGKVEVGNGVQTALAQIAAEELYFPVEKLDVVMGTTSETVDQGPTYGSATIHSAGPQIQHAAAAASQALIQLASDYFNLPPERLSRANGQISVIDRPEKKINYGELVAGKRLEMTIEVSGEKFNMKVAPDVTVKQPSAYTVIGKSVPRKDIPGKITGSFSYVQDVRIDGMLHGRVVRPYGVGARLLSVDESGLRSIPGFVKVVREGNFLGVLAETEWGAIQASRRLGSKPDPHGPTDGQAKWSNWKGLPNQDRIWDTVREASGSDTSIASSGSVNVALQKAKSAIRATYTTPFQMHGAIGPSCAVADVRAESATFWVGTQMPHESREHMAKLLDMEPGNVEMRWYGASGAFGRGGLEHVIADAALMSRAVGRPVRVQWMRWDEHGWEPKGPPITQDLEGAIDDQGKVVAWRHHMWVPTCSDTHLIAVGLANEKKLIGSTGLGKPPLTYDYTFDSADVACHGEARVGLLTSWLRSPGEFETTFAMESFIDELAAATVRDPLAFRLEHLKDERTIAVLRAAAQAYGWDSRPSPKKRGDGSNVVCGRGIAWVRGKDTGTRVATIADVTVERDSGLIRVKRVVVAHDCGLVVNPDGLRNQIEGNVIQSMSRALHEEVTFDNAHVTSRDWESYPILRFEEIPDSIEIVLVNNRPEYESLGAGEPSTCPTAAVIGNAVFDATGVRLRQTPFRPNRVKEALSTN